MFTADRRVLRLVRPLVGAYNAEAGSAVVGVSVVDVDLDQAERRLEALQTRSAISVALLVAGLFLVQFVTIEHSLVQRLTRLREVVIAFGKGDRASRAVVGTMDELGEVSQAFNRMADHVSQSIEAVAAAERMKADFVSFASHQLRTPLAGLNWTLELAETAPGLPDEALEHLRGARASSARLVQLVNDLLNVSRLESGRFDVRIAPLDLADLTRQVVGSLESLAEKKSLDLRFDDGPPVSPVSADAQLLSEALTNLVSNAIKYTKPGGRIRIGVRDSDGLVRWHVADTGIGVPAAQRDHLFEKFFRADNAIDLAVEGTGLGLSFVRLVVVRFGGRVWAESEEGRGTTFVLTLPALDAAGGARAPDPTGGGKR